VSQVAPCRAVAYALAIHVKNEAVVCADADGVGRGDGGKIQSAAKMENDGLAKGSGGVCDPGGVPLAFRQVDLGILRHEYIRAEGKREKSEESAHGIGSVKSQLTRLKERNDSG
jgi:hypothetical protein